MKTGEAVNSALKIIGLAGLSGVTVTAPSAKKAMAVLLRRSSVPAASHQSVLNELRRQKLVEIGRERGKVHFTITPAGAYRLQKVIVDELEVKMPRIWDKKWRMVSFDIPMKFSRQRAAFVQHLQNKGFYMLQKSMWVHPAPCFDVIEELASYYNLLRFCTFAEIDMLDDLSDRRLMLHFRGIIKYTR